MLLFIVVSSRNEFFAAFGMAAAPVGYRGRGPGDWDSYDLLGRSIYDILLRSQSPRTAISVFAQVNRQVDGARFRLEDFSSFG